MSNAGEWFDDKLIEVEQWLKEPDFIAYLDKQAPLPHRFVDETFAIIKHRYAFERERHESKN